MKLERNDVVVFKHPSGRDRVYTVESVTPKGYYLTEEGYSGTVAFWHVDFVISNADRGNLRKVEDAGQV